MAYYRQIYTTFWTDAKVADDFTPEDKYFYLYLLTNAHTSLCGCYEISKKQISIDTGYTIDVVDRLLSRMEKVHEIIRYSEDTKEVLLTNWHKYNWSKSEKVLKGVASEIERIKSNAFKDFLLKLLEAYGYPIDTVCIGYTYPMDTSVSVTVTDTVLNTVTDNESNNSIKPKRFTAPTVAEVQEYINEKGYSMNAEAFVDFYTSKGWKVGNQPMKDWKAAVRNWNRRDREDKRSSKNNFNNFPQHEYNMDDLTKKAKRRV